MGRPSHQAWDPSRVARLLDLKSRGLTMPQIAESMGVSVGTVYYQLNRSGVSTAPNGNDRDLRSRQRALDTLAHREHSEPVNSTADGIDVGRDLLLLRLRKYHRISENA